jgi:hypothetical protein
MWQIKKFKTKQAMIEWLEKHINIQWVEIFINNGYAIEYRPIHQINP